MISSEECRILCVLSGTNVQQMGSNDLAKRLGFKSKKDINPKLYGLRDKKLVMKVGDTPPLWEITDSGRAQVQMTDTTGMSYIYDFSIHFILWIQLRIQPTQIQLIVNNPN